MPLMGIREYARHRQVSHPAVLKALRSGRINQNADGLIDAEQADRDWVANTHPAPRAPRRVPSPAAADPGFARARTVRAHFEALTARHEYERRAAELLDANEVKVAAAVVSQHFRHVMLAVPETVAPRVAGESDPARVYALLTAAIREALTAFADAGEVRGDPDE